MGILDGYTNQTATHHTNSGFNDDGEPQTTSEAFSCRYQEGAELILDDRGRQIVSSAQIFTERPIDINDEITFESKRFPVKQSSKLFDLDGSFSHYKVWL